MIQDGLYEGFYKDIAQLQVKLGRDPIETTADDILEFIKKVFNPDNAAIIGMEGGLLGKWWLRSKGQKVNKASFEAIKQSLISAEGAVRGGLATSNPSESQIEGKIYSCISARIALGEDTLGAIYCELTKTEKREFSESQAELLLFIASFFAPHIYRFQLYLENKRAEERKLSESQSAGVQLIGESFAAKNLRAELASAVRITKPVLLLGETGTGKEVAARWIHANSPRAGGPFVPVHCAAVPKDLFESELFGHEKGSFSGALRKHLGKIELANSGILFLDEIGDVPLELQIKLLRALQEKTVSPVGAETEIGPIDFQLVCATAKDLKKMVDAETFRKDLYYRIMGLQITIPALRERIEDIPLLAAHFAQPKTFEQGATDLLAYLNWDGNIRQLQTIIEIARDLSPGTVISKATLLKQLRPHFPDVSGDAPAVSIMTFEDLKARWENASMNKQEVVDFLTPLFFSCESSIGRLAKRLGCTDPKAVKDFRNWLYNRKIAFPSTGSKSASETSDPEEPKD